MLAWGSWSSEVSQGDGIFQIESNFGTAAAIIEMLLYSRPGHIELLPALPAAWAATGSVSGVGVRGGFVADLMRDVAPEYHERILTLLLDGMVARRDGVTPMPAPPLTPEQLYDSFAVLAPH